MQPNTLKRIATSTKEQWECPKQSRPQQSRPEYWIKTTARHQYRRYNLCRSRRAHADRQTEAKEEIQMLQLWMIWAYLMRL